MKEYEQLTIQRIEEKIAVCYSVFQTIDVDSKISESYLNVENYFKLLLKYLDLLKSE